MFHLVQPFLLIKQTKTHHNMRIYNEIRIIH